QAALDVLTTGPSHEGLATAVASTLKELLTDTILVIDDFHVLDDNPAGGALIDHVLAHGAPHLHLVVASRTRPLLRSLPRLLVQHDAVVVDREALAFRPDEARSLLAESFSLSVDEDRARDLVERTEGWAAALSLVAQAAERQGLPALAGTPSEIFH